MRSSIKLIVGLLIVVGFFYMFTAPGRAVAYLCEDHPVGSPLASIEDIEQPFLVERMGPLPDPDNPGSEHAIFCATTTMCDTSCRLTMKDGFVIEARFVAL